MNRLAPLICLITPGHLGTSPRLVKEADALSEAGYRVHVVSGRHFAAAEPLDRAILAAGRWKHTVVDQSDGAGMPRKIGREIARGLVRSGLSSGTRVAARAQHTEIFRLAEAATQAQAGYYVGHCLAGLAAAAFAAGARGTPFGFDIEDYHDAETDDPSGLAPRLSRLLQGPLLPKCRHLTASSPLIAARIRENYGTTAAVVLNVLPLSHSPQAFAAPVAPSASRPARLYWFSQTVGPGRGLESVVRAMGKMRIPAVLQLRGFASPGYAAQLAGLARQCGLIRQIEFLPLAPPDEMARLAAQADLGLSTEESSPANRDLCLTNKIFTYLLAGIPQLLSRTAAQAALAPDLGAAALLADIADPGATAAMLDDFLGSPEKRAAAHGAAQARARARYCWDMEKSAFLAKLREAAGSA